MTYFVWLNERKAGPFDEVTLKAMLNGNAISQDTWAWKEGLPDWVPLSSLLTFMGAPGAEDGESPVTGANHVVDTGSLPVIDGKAEVCDVELTPVTVLGTHHGFSLGTSGGLTLYDWPHRKDDLGIHPPGVTPPQYTVANGIPISRDVFTALLKKADLGDAESMTELGSILLKNAKLHEDPVIAETLRSRGDYYFETGLAKMWPQKITVAR